MDTEKFRVCNGEKIKLSKIETNYSDKFESKDEAADLQDKLYGLGKYSLLIIIQAMDAAGKDSLIKHVMSGLNPQGTQVFSFKQPSAEELNYDYMWRTKNPGRTDNRRDMGETV